MISLTRDSRSWAPPSCGSGPATVSTLVGGPLWRICRSGTRARASAATRSCVPSFRGATVTTTGMPRISLNRSASTRPPLASSSSYMLRTRTMGRCSSTSCRVRSNARRRFLASAICTTVAAGLSVSSPRVTRASSLRGDRSFSPGVSMTSCSKPLNDARARTNSTVVPG